MTPGIELLIVLAVFIGLLCAGMTIPFAILVPSILYLLLQSGLAGLEGLGLVSWGSMNSFTLSAIPLFILMSEILQESRLSQRVYRGLSMLLTWLPGGLLQTNIAGCAIFASISGSSVATAASNLAFDASLKARNGAWGIRRVADVDALAASKGFERVRRVEMPANNLILAYRKA